MKVLIILALGLLAVGCGKQEQTTTAKPVKEPTREDVVGTYELKIGTVTNKNIFLDNGTIEYYANGENQYSKRKWSIVGKDIHIDTGNPIGIVQIHRLNPDNSMTVIAVLIGGERRELPKNNQHTFNKIK